VRWALIEAIQRIPKDSVIGRVKDAIIARRGRGTDNAGGMNSSAALAGQPGVDSIPTSRSTTTP
jgi:hypothetical protein